MLFDASDQQHNQRADERDSNADIGSIQYRLQHFHVDKKRNSCYNPGGEGRHPPRHPLICEVSDKTDQFPDDPQRQRQYFELRRLRWLALLFALHVVPSFRILLYHSVVAISSVF